jgi:uncharacterized protein (TIGR00730 family)
MEAEHALADVDELVVTKSMHERKLHMYERSDAFVALPGGIGTLEEFVEQMTWNQIGQHDKPLVLANVQGYWDPLIDLFDHMLRHAPSGPPRSALPRSTTSKTSSRRWRVLAAEPRRRRQGRAPEKL